MRVVDDRVHRAPVARRRARLERVFLTNFENFLLLILYLFIPWTAVNLVDYYVVRRGHYAVEEIFKPDGIYGRWGWRGIRPTRRVRGDGAVLLTPSFTGPIAKAMDGADLSLFVGLPVAGGLYLLFARTIDVDAERRLAEREAEELEEMASEHAMPTATA